MKKLLALATLLVATAASAADKPAAPPAAPPAAAPSAAAAAPDAAGMPDMTKMGPWSRPVLKPDTKGVQAYLANQEEIWKKGDVNAAADALDFPVVMVTDDSAGKESHISVERAQWIQMMAPFMSMPEEAKKGMSVKAKNNIQFITESLALVISDITTKMGKEKHTNKAVTLLVKVGDQWKGKMMIEGGWGDMAKAGGK